MNMPTRNLYFVGNAASADVPSNVVGSTYGSFGASYEGYFLAQLAEADLEMTKGSLVLGQNSAAPRFEPRFEPRTQSSSCAATSATVLPLGCSLIWNPQLTNLGPAGATNPVVTGATPTGVNVTSCTYTSTSGPSGTCLSNNAISLSPAQIAELIGQLAANNSINFTISATTNDCYSTNNSPGCMPPGSQVNWSLTASSATEDPNLSNNTASINFALQSVVQFQSMPSGLLLSTPLTASAAPNSLATPFQRFWDPSASYTATAPGPQPGPPGTQYVFSNWTNGSTAFPGASPMLAISEPQGILTVVANFSAQYQLTANASPSNGGSIGVGSALPVSSGATWEPAASIINLTATPQPGFVFTGWSGAVASASSPTTTITMTAPNTVTANFAPVSSASPAHA